MAAMFAARYPHKVATLVTAGAPLDCDAGEGFVKKIAKEQPMSFFEDLVIQGGGLMRGKFMLAGWKSMHPEEHYFKTYLDLYENVEDPAFIKKREEFERWKDGTNTRSICPACSTCKRSSFCLRTTSSTRARSPR
jgi:poly-beta-hydroxyalkanoate depolymerase